MSQELNNKKIAILVADGFEQVELTKPKEAFEEAGAQTQIISLNSDRVQGYITAQARLVGTYQRYNC